MSHTTHKEALTSLAQYCLDLAKGALARNDSPFRTETRMRISCTSFEYSESGLKAPRRGSTVEILDWGHACHMLLELVKESTQWEDAAASVKPFVDNDVEMEQLLTKYCQKQLLPLLGKGGFKKLSPESAAAFLIREFDGEPLECRASFSIEGIMLLGASLSLELEGARVHIRPSVAQDLTCEQPPFAASGHQLWDSPTAILTTARVCKHPSELQKLGDKILATLRLYRVCSANLTSAHLESDAIRGFAGLGMLHRRAPKSTVLTGVIRPSEIEHLELFIQTVLPRLPDSHSHPRSDAPLSIALKRYDDALLDARTFDHRILGAMMALEAAMLGSDEMHELGFKLSIRTARLLSYFGSNPSEIQACLKLAYRIRSKYVHGSLASPSVKRKVVSGFGTEADFTNDVFNIVRKTLLIMLLVSVTKKEFIQSLDSALIGAQLSEFGEKLAVARQYVHD